MKTVSYALACARRGWRVFPVAAGKKAPPLVKWKAEATTDEDTIRGWWEEWPDVNLAIACGEESDIMVLDIDGPEGYAWLARYEEQHGKLPHTLRSLTRSGLEHILFRYREGLGNAVKPVPGIDIRTQGGYVLTANSRVQDEETGEWGSYQWSADGHPSEVELAEIPEALFQALKPRPKKAAPKRENKKTQTPQGTTADKYAAFRSLSRLGPEIAEEYQTWLEVGQALHSIDPEDTELLTLWDAWSQQSSKYEAGDCEKRWASFGADRGYTVATLIHYARAGASRSWAAAPESPPTSWPEEPPRMGALVIGGKKAKVVWPEPDGEWSEIQDQTDVGNAQRLAWLLRDKVRAIHGRTVSAWLTWDGRRWEHGSAAETKALQLCMEALWHGVAWVAESAPDEKGTARYVTRTRSKAGIDAAISLAKRHPRLAVGVEDLDAHSHLMVYQNGVVDLRDGSLHDHDPDLLITRAAPVPYEPGAANGMAWTELLLQLAKGDVDLATRLEAALGASLFGEHWSQFLLFTGPTGTGKSTLLSALSAALGSGSSGYVQTMKWETVGEVRGLSNHDAGLAALQGCRIAYCPEVPDNARFGARIKMLTGDRTITYRAPYGATEETLICSATLILAANRRPQTPPTEGGESIMRRMKILPFDQQFTEDRHKLEAEPDRYLPADPSTIAAFLGEGGVPGRACVSLAAALVGWAVRWWNDRELPFSARAAACHDEYAAENKHELEAFLDECTILSTDAWTSRTDLYEAYRGWAQEEGITKPLKKQGRYSLGTLLNECVRNSARYGNRAVEGNVNQSSRDAAGGRREKGWRGITLSTSGLALQRRGAQEENGGF